MSTTAQIPWALGNPIPESTLALCLSQNFATGLLCEPQSIRTLKYGRYGDDTSVGDPEQICKFLGLSDLEPLVRGMDPDPAPDQAPDPDSS
jgi:hypothetical protein